MTKTERKETLEIINRKREKPTYESVLEFHYSDDPSVDRDYMVYSGCKDEMKMLSFRIERHLREGFTKEELQPLYNLYEDYADLRNTV
jgi:hypothetical protein